MFFQFQSGCLLVVLGDNSLTYLPFVGKYFVESDLIGYNLGNIIQESLSSAPTASPTDSHANLNSPSIHL